MTNQTIMPWVDALPDAAGLFQTERNEIATMMKEAEALVQKSNALKQAAYLRSLKLESKAKVRWSADVVERAKLRTGQV